MCGLFSLVNYNHLNILAYVYHGSIVNSRLNNKKKYSKVMSAAFVFGYGWTFEQQHEKTYLQTCA